MILINNLNFLTTFIYCDLPESWQVNIQDPASPSLEGMITFHEYLMFFLIQIGLAVCWYLWKNKKSLSTFSFTHESTLEIYWTILPALILLFIAVPSFILLYSLDDVVNPTISVKIVGHQWYWSYEYNDVFANADSEFFLANLSFDSYLISTSDLLAGQLRLLEVDHRLILPTNTHIRLLICSSDVLHSWAVPSAGTKMDACPGRVSEVNLFFKRAGVYYGQCSEICGTNHGLMPIVIRAVPEATFWYWTWTHAADASLSHKTVENFSDTFLWYDESLVSNITTTVATLFSFKNFRAGVEKIQAFFASHVRGYNTPGSINYMWSFGAMAGIFLVGMIISGTLLATHYIPSMELAFDSVDHIMVDVKYGWLLRYGHANGASVFFIVVYVHIFKGIFFCSYSGEKKFVWYIGLIIFILMMATAFIGYVLPWGQMSLWGATVITNLFSSIPNIGQQFVDWLWGAYSVDGPTLVKFFAIHFTLPYIIVALVFVHLAALHAVGSNNPAGCENVPTINFAPSFIIKDVFVFFLVFFLLAVLIIWYPNFLGHPDNYIRANPLVTPAHIVPEWYFLPFYAILRSIPDKTGGIIAMAASILSLFFLPLLNSVGIKSATFRPIYGVLVTSFAVNVAFLGWIGQLPVEAPYVIMGQFATGFYFLFFILVWVLSHFDGKLNPNVF